MEKRITKKEMFLRVREAVIGDIALVDFIDHEIELLDNKANRHTQTKTQKENEELKTIIVNVLTFLDKPVSITELQEENPELATKTNQKLSALLKQLVDSGLVKRVPDKKRTLFQIV